MGDSQWELQLGASAGTALGLIFGLAEGSHLSGRGQGMISPSRGAVIVGCVLSQVLLKTLKRIASRASIRRGGDWPRLWPRPAMRERGMSSHQEGVKRRENRPERRR